MCGVPHDAGGPLPASGGVHVRCVPQSSVQLSPLSAFIHVMPHCVTDGNKVWTVPQLGFSTFDYLCAVKALSMHLIFGSPIVRQRPQVGQHCSGLWASFNSFRHIYSDRAICGLSGKTFAIFSLFNCRWREGKMLWCHSFACLFIFSH